MTQQIEVHKYVQFTYSITDGSATVQVSDANGAVHVDAVRAERVGDVGGPEIQVVVDDTTNVNDGGPGQLL